LNRVYESDELFPFFSNRVLCPSRPDYPDFGSWLAYPASQRDPIALLARSGGQPETDSFQVFAPPEREAPGRYGAHFFVHGIRHLPEDSHRRAQRLQPKDRLLVMHDFQNAKDPDALLLRTAETTPNDVYLIGYCPRYLLAEAFSDFMKDTNWPNITVEQINPPPAPLQFRALCRMVMACPELVVPCSGESYRPLVEPLVEATP